MSVDEQRSWFAYWAKEKITKIFEKASFNFGVFKMAVDRINKRKQRKKQKEEKKPPPMDKLKNTITDLDYIWKFGILVMLGLLFYALDS